MKRKVFKWLLYSILGIAMVLITLLTALSSVYDKTIVKVLKKYLNEHLLTEIIVEEMDFSMIRKFPHATVEFSNVVIRSKAGLNYEGFPKKVEDTLMSASKVYFQFGLLGLLKNEFVLKRIHLVDGKMNVLKDKNGRDNYTIWKSIEKETTGEDYNIEFNDVIISSFSFYYNNQFKPFVLQSFITKMMLSGSLSGDDGSYALKADMNLHKTGQGSKMYLKDLPVTIDFKASSQHDTLLIHDGKINLNKLPVDLSGHVIFKPTITVDLSLNSANFGLDEICSLIPQNNKSTRHTFSIEGKGKFNMHIKGPFFSEQFPRIDAEYILTNGSLTNKKTKSKLSHVKIAGTISGDRPSNYNILFSKLEARLSTGRITGKGRIYNLKNPVYNAEINSTINLNNLYKLIEFDDFEYLQGIVQAHLKTEGHLIINKPFTPSNLLSNLKYGSLEIEDCSFKLKKADYTFEDVNGIILIDNKISFQDFAFTLNHTYFLATGHFENVFDYLSDKKSIIHSNLYLYSKVLDFNNLTVRQKDTSNVSTGLKFPDHFNANVKITADEFRIGKFDAKNLKCDAAYSEKTFNIKNFNFKFIDGSISGNSSISQASDSCFLIECNADLKYIDIQQLFSSFNNFRQNFIVDENLRGKLGSHVIFSACWNDHMDFLPASLIAQADIEIINGELLKFDPMLSLSKYIHVDELRHIKFKTLSNTIYIYNRQIKIPEMLINTSAFNIALSGTHSFDNAFDYRLKLALSDVLFRKAKRKKKDIDDYLIMENDVEKSVLPVSIIGYPDNFDVSFDSKRAFDLIKKNIQQQGAEMNEIFWGNSSPSDEKPEKSDDKPIIEWEEEQKESPRPKETKTHHSGDEIRIKWEEEDSSDFIFFN
ncbi:MAG: hypothetical protein JXR41_14610 [Bacteroidales bacterium]|nr:hypothetical protein [Bacteroidales bacterium]MBN2764323.1 hypothetical protein [Bacteroidales bacterium]